MNPPSVPWRVVASGDRARGDRGRGDRAGGRGRRQDCPARFTISVVWFAATRPPPRTTGALTAEEAGRRSSGSATRQFVDDFTDRIHVHLRDAEAGYIHHSIGNGQVDFADTASALAEIGYTGKFSLELETRDIENDERPQAALKAGRYFSSLV